ncbi:MAG: hypothetical protein ACFFA7_17345 [Promethearchaeota archaeon]
MWENPYYFFRIPFINEKGEVYLEELIINVILSAYLKDTKPDLNRVLKILMDRNSDYKINTVLDFGSGKLRTVNYITRMEKNLTAVDYKEILVKYDYLNEKLINLKSNNFFNKMDFPNPFLKDATKYDLCLLINTLPTIPVFLERLLILQILQDKIINGKYLLWYAMNVTNYDKRAREKNSTLGDGLWMKGRDKNNHRTFYKYHPPGYLVFILYLSGFKFIRSFDVSSVDAMLFERTEYNLFKDYITEDLIKKEIKSEMLIEDGILKPKHEISSEINPYPEEYNLFGLIKKFLNNLETGIKNAEIFKRLSAGIFQYFFSSQLKNMTIEDPIDEGKGFVDVTFQTTDSPGFFKRLQKKNIYDTKSPIIFVECKNIKKKLENNEYNQMYSRFGEKRGSFGVIICRDKKSEEAVFEITKRRTSKGYVIVLDDNDIIKLLKSRIEDGEKAVDDYFENEMKKLLMASD